MPDLSLPPVQETRRLAAAYRAWPGPSTVRPSEVLEWFGERQALELAAELELETDRGKHTDSPPATDFGRLTRRQVLGGVAAVGAAGALTAMGSSSAEAVGHHPKVVVVGAGLAGLSCTYRLRRNGIKEEHLRQWRENALSGFSTTPSRASGEDRKRIKELERELTRKDKALAETAALLVLQGKMEALWAAEDDATRQNSEEPPSRASRKRKKQGRN